MISRKIMGIFLSMGLLLCGFGAEARAASSQTTLVGVVNINTASSIELMQLPGIGLAKADQIVAYREHRQFRKTSDLMKIKGIGKKMYDRIADNLTVNEPTKMTIIRRTKEEK